MTAIQTSPLKSTESIAVRFALRDALGDPGEEHEARLCALDLLHEAVPTRDTSGVPALPSDLAKRFIEAYAGSKKPFFPPKSPPRAPKAAKIRVAGHPKTEARFWSRWICFATGAALLAFLVSRASTPNVSKQRASSRPAPWQREGIAAYAIIETGSVRRSRRNVTFHAGDSIPIWLGETLTSDKDTSGIIIHPGSVEPLPASEEIAITEAPGDLSTLAKKGLFGEPNTFGDLLTDTPSYMESNAIVCLTPLGRTTTRQPVFWWVAEPDTDYTFAIRELDGRVLRVARQARPPMALRSVEPFDSADVPLESGRSYLWELVSLRDHAESRGIFEVDASAIEEPLPRTTRFDETARLAIEFLDSVPGDTLALLLPFETARSQDVIFQRVKLAALGALGLAKPFKAALDQISF